MPLSVPTGLGLAGAGLVVLAYLFNQTGWLDSADWRFPASNLLGSLLIGISLWFEFNLPSMLIEVFWAAISLYGIARALRRVRA
jgi:hypothetical protein